MKKELKYFLLGVASTIVGALLIYGAVLLVNKLTRKPHECLGEGCIQESKSEVYGEYRYTESDYEEGSIECDILSNAKVVSYNYILGNDGYLYDFSTNKRYSENNKNCKKASDTKFKKVINGYFISDDNQLYHYDSFPEERKLELSTESIADYFYSDDVIYATYTYPCPKYSCYNVLKEDGKIYYVEISNEYHYDSYSDKSEYIYKVEKEEVIISFEDEKVKRFTDVSSSSASGFIVTDKSIYTKQLSNSECNLYADVSCVYKFEKNEFLDNKYDDILFVSNYDISSILYYTKDGKNHSVWITSNEEP